MDNRQGLLLLLLLVLLMVLRMLMLLLSGRQLKRGKVWMRHWWVGRGEDLALIGVDACMHAGRREYYVQTCYFSLVRRCTALSEVSVSSGGTALNSVCAV
jgi:hypothetical protein